MRGTTCGRIWEGVSKVASNVLNLHSQKLQDPDKVVECLQKKKKTKTKKLTNVMAIPKRHNPAGYDASPSVRKMENSPKNSRANPDTRSVTSITKRENWNHRMGQVRKDQSRVIWSNLPAQEKPLEHITQYCFQIVLEDLL